MREFLQRLLERLHNEARPLSRNRHFYALEGEARGALRIDRHLRDLERDLTVLMERGERPRIKRLPRGRVQIVVRHEALSLVRTATLTAEETSLLARHPAGAWALGLAGEPASASRKTGD